MTRPDPRRSADDMLPLIEGLTLEYQGDADAGVEAGSYRKLEILDVRAGGGVTRAKYRWTRRLLGGNETTREGVVSKGDGWAACDGSFLEMPAVRLFPLPPLMGVRWDEERWSHQVSALDAKVGLGDDAGAPMVAEGCLQVSWSFDEGSGQNVYAPGIGLVRSSSTDEQYPFAFVLTRATFPPAAPRGRRPR